ncbi:DUF1572 family protein [Ornithinibacillus scapharcae]|uniref:DUF1572 family protein n=1 Tax=Ornithinibacillus scapharcae TaxID=1147159 RepID=UPI000225AD5E|nr:DUF1572 family protein [Ornithinibacillus scapharcae]
MNIENQYLKVVIERFKGIKVLGDKTIAQLSEAELHWKYNNESNSIAVIMKHMGGNLVSRWTDFLTTDGEKEDRNRDGEFIDDKLSKSETLAIWDKGWKIALDTLHSLHPDDLLKTVYIRGEAHNVIDAIERQLAHAAYHIGQMVYIGKQIKDSQWTNLSIPKGKSQEYLKSMLDEQKEN